METRHIELTIEQAVEWWLGNNQTLRQLALSTYSEEELKDEFYSSIGVNSDTITVDMLTFSSFSRLKAIANYFNNGWTKTINTKGYFICKADPSSINCKAICSDYCILSHERVVYPCIVYFQTIESAKKAIKIMGDSLEYLFDEQKF